MINRNKFKENLTKSLLSATQYSRSVLDSIDRNYSDVEGRKWATALIADWEQTIKDIDEEMTQDYLSKGAE